MRKSKLLLAVAGVALTVTPAVQAQVAFTWTRKASFGTNGYLSPTSTAYLTTDNTQRSFAYNRMTGNLVLVSRGTNTLNIIDGTSGLSTKSLTIPNGFITSTGGNQFAAINTVGITDDGVIYVSNASTDISGSGYRLYRWGNENDTNPTVVYTGTTTSPGMPNNSLFPSSGTYRLGDTMKIVGSESNGTAALFAGVRTGIPGYTGLTRFTLGSGGPTPISFNNGPGALDNEFRLSVSALNSTRVYSSSGNSNIFQYTISGSTLNYDAWVTQGVPNGLASGGEVLHDAALIGNNTVVFTGDANNNSLRAYDITTPNSPKVLYYDNFQAVSNITNYPTGTSFSFTNNQNNTGQVVVAQKTPRSPFVTVYWMATNEGLNAVDFTFQYTGSWAVNASGSWNTDTNWDSGVAPTQNISSAAFGPIITSPSTVTLTGSIVTKGLTFTSPISYTIASSNGPSGATAIVLQGPNGTAPVNLTVTQGNHFINSTVYFQRDLNVSVAPTASLTVSRLDVTSTLSNTVTFSGGGTVKVTTMALPRIHMTATPDTLVDLLSGGAIFFKNTEAEIRGLVTNWYNGGAKNGKGLGSSVAAADANKTLAVFTNTANDGVTPYFDSYAGHDLTTAPVPLTASTVFAVVTYQGDVNLDGKVDGKDYKTALESAIFGRTGWLNGDVNYDGVVNNLDLALINSKVPLNLPALTGMPTENTAGIAAIPEPVGLLPLALSGAALRRRRQQR